MAERYQPSPKPSDELPEPPEGMRWTFAFWDMGDDPEEYATIDFNGRRFKYRLVPETEEE